MQRSVLMRFFGQWLLAGSEPQLDDLCFDLLGTFICKSWILGGMFSYRVSVVSDVEQEREAGTSL